MGVDLKNKSKELVILIDDSDIDNFIGQKTLEFFGANNIMVFNKPSDALDYLRTTTNKPSLMFIDIHMPLMNGYEFMEELRGLEISKYSSGIYFLSASINPKDKDMAKEKGVGLIDKPLTIEKLITIFENIQVYPSN